MVEGEHGRQPLFPSPLPAPPTQPRNSPWAILGVVVALALALTFIVAPGTFTRTVAGVPLAAPTQADDKPNAAAPVAPSSTAPETPKAQSVTDTNALLNPGKSLPAVNCKLPAFGKSADQLRNYYQAMIGCLDSAWKPVLEQAHEPFESPSLNVEDDPVSGCGTPSSEIAVAFYCPKDKTIFMPRNRVVDSMGANQGGHIMVLAHEYGHHVQMLSGITRGLGYKMGGKDENSPEYLELTRRMELQADCFSGMFIGAVSGRGSIGKTLGTSASGAFRSSVADKTHGSVKHQIQWGTAGVKNNNTASCNTWTAASGDVS
ncbi:neutral zinc metallopeptidase [Actinocrispum sp. NPDC049592]|uniref:neutral zinc metallopeptidase n=1 Tax=Actinocrispum sp. NPDC049592 TaxID=3154835 RepID=UPI003418AF80